LALAAIIVPFAFVYSPTILLQGGSLNDIVVTATTALIGSIGLAAAVSGYFFAPASWFERGVLVVASVALIFHDARGDFGGLMLLALVAVIQIIRRRRVRPRVAEGGLSQP
jgi:TRAP-type uncharacterized transport system fused permease subunit